MNPDEFALVAIMTSFMNALFANQVDGTHFLKKY